MPSKEGRMSDGARKAYAAQRKEGLKLWLAGFCMVSGVGAIFLTIFARLIDFAVGGIVGLILIACGLLVYRTTVAHEIAKKGPRIPRRIRLPFDSVVEIGVQTNVVQSRADVVVGDRRPPEPKEESENKEE
jgi:hypothetical protein